MNDTVLLNPISNDRKNQYKELVTLTYSKLYDDVDDTMAGHIVTCHDEGKDPFGYFTLKKCVFEIYTNETHVGFTTLTFKRGGSVKTGPTILFPEFRGKSIGPQVQKRLAETALRNGYRKIYGTCSTLNSAAVCYMIKSGYEIEAYLKRHYSNEANEIVFGKSLSSRNITPRQSIYMEEESSFIKEISINSIHSYQNKLKEYFAKTLLDVDEKFLYSLPMNSDVPLICFNKKPRRVLGFFNDSNQIQSAAVLIPKRGKTLKCNMLGYFDEKALQSIIHWVNKEAEPIGFRKLSVFLPACFIRQTELLGISGFSFEGRLRSPYRENIDIDIYSLFLR